MTSIGEVYDHFLSNLTPKVSSLDFAYAVEDTSAHYGIAENEVRYIIEHVEGSLFHD